jgi:hypothetical protein
VQDRLTRLTVQLRAELAGLSSGVLQACRPSQHRARIEVTKATQNVTIEISETKGESTLINSYACGD